MKRVKLPKVECKRCGHIWIPKKETIYVCPKCHSAWWNQKREGDKDGINKRANKL